MIDYPGFNLHLAKKLSKLDIQCHFIVSPQIWAWNYKRIYKIKKYVKNILCLYEFETKIYKRHNISAHFMGHPLIENIRVKTRNINNSFNKKYTQKYISLLPGSRRREIDRILPFILKLCKKFIEKNNNNENIQFLLPCPNDKNLIKKIKQYTAPYKNLVKLMPGQVHEALSKSYAAIACSGTITLECLAWRVPFCLLYATSWPTYFIFKQLIKISHIGIVNIMAGKLVHQEFIQGNLKEKNVLPEFTKIMFDQLYRKNMLKEFEHILKRIPEEDPVKKATSIIKNILS